MVEEETLVNYIVDGRDHGSLGSSAVFFFHQQPERRRLGFGGTVSVLAPGVGLSGRGGVGVLWRVRSNAERGIAACGVWVGALFRVLVWFGVLRLLLGVVVDGVDMSVIDELRRRERWDGAVGGLGTAWSWEEVESGVTSDAAVSSTMSAAVSIVSFSNSSAAREPVRLAMWSKGSEWSAVRSAMGSSWLSSLSI